MSLIPVSFLLKEWAVSEVIKAQKRRVGKRKNDR